jgi:DNA modification methylase
MSKEAVPNTITPLIQADAAAGLAQLPDCCAQVIIADPPYFNVQVDEQWDTQWATPEAYLKWCREWVAEGMRVLRHDGLFFIFGQPGQREHVFIHLMSQICQQAEFHDLIIWDRAVGYNERRDSFTPQYEMIIAVRKGLLAYFDKSAVRIPYDEKTIQQYLKDPRYKDKAAREAYLREGKYATNILRVPSLKGASSEKIGHPTQKPLALIRNLISAASRPGDLIVDPFMGSGTTAHAAQELGRRWIGVEIEPEYVEMTRQRLKRLTEADLSPVRLTSEVTEDQTPPYMSRRPKHQNRYPNRKAGSSTATTADGTPRKRGRPRKNEAARGAADG